jgi:hypothetical protein
MVDIAGPEPIGHARAANPECDAVWHKVMEHQELLNQNKIHLWE